MNYVYVENGKVTQTVLPEVGTLKDGRTVSGYNLLDDITLRAEGWLPLVETPPNYDPVTQILQPSGYTVEADQVIQNYAISNIIDGIKNNKIAEINKAAGDKINGGFFSYAEGKTDSTGAPIVLLYKSDSDHREQLGMINYLAQQHKAGQLTDMPCSWKDASQENEPCHEISDDAVLQLYIELGKHMLWCKQVSDTLDAQIMAATTVDEVNAVTFPDEPMPTAPTTTS